MNHECNHKCNHDCDTTNPGKFVVAIVVAFVVAIVVATLEIRAVINRPQVIPWHLARSALSTTPRKSKFRFKAKARSCFTLTDWRKFAWLASTSLT